MSKMSEVYIDVLDMLEKGDHPSKIAFILDVPVSMVYDILEQMEYLDDFSPFQTVNS